MLDVLSEIKKNCEILFSTLDLDVLISDRSGNIQMQLLHNPWPEELMTRWGAYHARMLSMLDASKQSCVWHSMYNGLMLFLDLRISVGDDECYVTLGPALTKTISDVAFADLIHRETFHAKTVHTIKNYIKKAPFFTLKTRNAFWISCQLLGTSLPPTEEFPLNAPVSTPEMQDFPITGQQILLNAHAEQRWLAFVAAGDAPSARKALLQMSSNDFVIQQSHDPERTSKNLLHTINGMCKAAAYAGGAAPHAIFAVSRKAADTIEAIESALGTEKVAFQMLDHYCQAVVDERTLDYSLPVKMTIEFISNHYAENITRKKIAQEIHYSEGHLTRIFQKETGQKIAEYLYALRIKNACRLLESGSYSVTDVALLTGFSSYGKFSVEFRKRMGMTASEYQKSKSDHHIPTP